MLRRIGSCAIWVLFLLVSARTDHSLAARQAKKVNEAAIGGKVVEGYDHRRTANFMILLCRRLAVMSLGALILFKC